MEILADLIKRARSNGNGIAERGDVSVEINCGVLLYSVNDRECTATEAADRLDEM